MNNIENINNTLIRKYMNDEISSDYVESVEEIVDKVQNDNKEIYDNKEKLKKKINDELDERELQNKEMYDTVNDVINQRQMEANKKAKKKRLVRNLAKLGLVGGAALGGYTIYDNHKFNDIKADTQRNIKNSYDKHKKSIEREKQSEINSSEARYKRNDEIIKNNKKHSAEEIKRARKKNYEKRINNKKEINDKYKSRLQNLNNQYDSKNNELENYRYIDYKRNKNTIPYTDKKVIDNYNKNIPSKLRNLGKQIKTKLK